MVQISSALRDFHIRYCPNVPIDSPDIIFHLLEELLKIKNKNMNEEEMNEQEREIKY